MRYLFAAHRRYCREQIELYVHGVQERVYASFRNIEVEADLYRKVKYRDFSQALSFGEDGEAECYEAANEAALEHFFGLQELQREVTCAATAGLFHLWEKLMKLHLWREFRYGRPWHSNRAKLDGLKFQDLKKELDALGQSIDGAIWMELNVLRLVANVSKHGRGAAFSKLKLLLNDTPLDVFEGESEYPEAVTPEDLWISEDRFDRFGCAAIRSWDGVPLSENEG